MRRIDAKSAIEFAANVAKEYYNSRYTLIKLNVNNLVYLQLYKGYYLLGKPNRKILEQRTSPFRIKKKVGRLAYELDFLLR